ncbi:hypothetical protein PC9H_007826 [Pleurotus ostreatus]|uniref:Alcohol dehydrogenase iron-type/glycerol dehydrogenase GldA domain-containing protein n=1 Tax=Pleurotus ostreatus TaxID=5322 RepID=A0A8H7DS16_PLEOS|nr:uncharacterized protein PC9H_007826 [Pleurotus ostreatus]KAF7428599.1 hypothetical protein PC9H_007826 [Pleurotus ostreatus]
MSSIDSSQAASNGVSGFYSYTDTLKGVYYGPGCVKTALPQLLEIIGAKRALVVTGKSLHEKTDVVRRVEAILKEHDAYGATFHEIGEHSPIAGIRAGIQAFKNVGADVIVAVGGGSPVDASKAMLYFLHEEGGPQRYQIAIPTTLSAAEYSIGAGYTNDEGAKVAVSSQALAPAGIILDAELTLATPARLWPLIPHPVKVLCYSAMADLFKYLPLSRDHPENVEYRQWLQIASWMSLWPTRLQKYSALGLSHALGHKLGAAYSIPHGITSCLTLSPTVKLMAEIGSEVDKQYLAKTLFYLESPSTGSLNGDVQKLSSLIQQLVIDLRLDSNLAEYNVPTADLPKVAELALGTKDSPNFPKVVDLLKSLYPPA